MLVPVNADDSYTTVVSEAQFANTLLPILVTDAGIVTLVIPEYWNAFAPIVVTVVGIVNSVIAAQFLNAYVPIDVKPEGNAISLSDEQPLNI
jgi:hypothetical protein